MKAKKDANQDTDNELEEESSDGGSKKKEKIKKIAKLAMVLVGAGFMIYNVMFANNDGNGGKDATDKQDSAAAAPAPPPPSPAQEEIKLETVQKGEIAKKEMKSVKEFDIATSKLEPTKPPEILAPDVPPLPNFQFDTPKLPPKDEPKKTPESQNTPESPKSIEPPKPDIKQQKIPNPDAIIDAKKKSFNMFAFSSGTGGFGGGTPKAKDSKSSGDKDFTIYDKTKLIEESKDAANPKNATVTQITNLENLVAQGKMIDVVLETAINSQLPGAVRGIVSRDVFAEAGVKILIPKGTRVYGSYTSTVIRGQSRLNVVWNRMIRPDGVSVQITSQASDQFGRVGIEADVDNRFGEIFSNSLLLSFVNLGTAVALQKITGTDNGQTQVVNNNGSVATTNINPVNMAAQTVIQNTSEIVRQLTDGALNLQPIVTLPQGTRLKVIVNQDVNLPDYIKERI